MSDYEELTDEDMDERDEKATREWVAAARRKLQAAAIRWAANEFRKSVEDISPGMAGALFTDMSVLANEVEEGRREIG